MSENDLWDDDVDLESEDDSTEGTVARHNVRHEEEDWEKFFDNAHREEKDGYGWGRFDDAGSPRGRRRRRSRDRFLY